MVIVPAPRQDTEGHPMPAITMHTHWLDTCCNMGGNKPAKQQGRPQGRTGYKGNEVIEYRKLTGCSWLFLS